MLGDPNSSEIDTAAQIIIGENGLVASQKGQIQITSIGKFHMREYFQYIYPASNYGKSSTFITNREEGATLIYDNGGKNTVD